MSTATVTAAIQRESLADLVRRLGDVPLVRISLHPAPGTAVEEDVIAAGIPACELADGVLVERPKGYFEGRLAAVLLVLIEKWLTDNNLGYCNGEGAWTRLQEGVVRVPDLSFVRWERTPDHRVPRDPVCGIVPNLAVEILSPGNTHREMERKRHEYFEAGVELLWIVDPVTTTVEVWSTVKECRILDENDTLDGGQVLPGLNVSIRDWFARAEGR